MVVMWRPDWPALKCPETGHEHAMEDLGDIFGCFACYAKIRKEESAAWWGWHNAHASQTWKIGMAGGHWREPAALS